MTRFFEKIFYYQKTNRVLSHVLFWLAVLLISVNLSKYEDGKEFSYGFAFTGNALYLVPQIVASYLLTYWVIPQFFFRKKYVLALGSFFAGSYLTCVLARFLMVRVAEPLAGMPPAAFETNREILTDLSKLFYRYFFNIFSLAFVFMFIKLLKDQLDIQKRTLTLEKQKAEAELKLLKTQLNPHFLFNTLNNIYSLSITASPATSPSIARLAEILDHILYRCNTEFVPLCSEIALLNNYIGLEKLRYDERLKVTFNVEADQNIEIAPLIMLNIVENAFKHGAARDSGNPFIRIDLTADQLFLNFRVVNSATRRPQEAGEKQEKIGLNNLRQQLGLIYGSNYRLEIEQTEKQFAVFLQIALKANQRQI
ncbi:sensor histidine kinase [Mucilaginibacter sp. NFX135]|uniref:sensor histidine kinase n=1 Tax=Mucilaginibacter sp. NFX135 TaxID=3402687 RepID=UPI003AFA1836